MILKLTDDNHAGIHIVGMNNTIQLFYASPHLYDFMHVCSNKKCNAHDIIFFLFFILHRVSHKKEGFRKEEETKKGVVLQYSFLV